MAIFSAWNGWFKVCVRIEGYNTETPLKRIARSGIPLFAVKRKSRREIAFQVYRKDFQKALLFFGVSCYNNDEKEYGAYRVISVSPAGLYRTALAVKKRSAFWIGSILFPVCVLLSQNFPLAVRLTGEAKAYEVQIGRILAEEGVSPFRRYQSQNALRAVPKLLSLPDVSFASVQKDGYLITVYLAKRKSQPLYEKENVYAPASGKIVSIVVLSGEACVCVGESVNKGDLLVSAQKTTADGNVFPVLAAAKITLAEEKQFFFLTREEALLCYETCYGERADYSLAAEDEGYRLTVCYEHTYTYRVKGDL